MRVWIIQLVTVLSCSPPIRLSSLDQITLQRGQKGPKKGEQRLYGKRLNFLFSLA